MPAPSFFPLIAALGLPFIAAGMIYTWPLIAIGAVLLLVGVFGWVYEPAEGD